MSVVLASVCCVTTMAQPATAVALHPTDGGAIRVRLPMALLTPDQHVVPGNCGTAFVYLSRVEGLRARAVFGFEHLTHRAIGYTADLTLINEDTGHNDTDRTRGGLFFQTSFQREVTKETGFGDVVVYPHIKALTDYGFVCVSSTELNAAVLVY
jgi:hypothetical protein